MDPFHPHATSHSLHHYSVPDGFREWCHEHNIQAHLFEHFDGGGSTGFTVTFADPLAMALATEKFSDWKDGYYPSDYVRYLGAV